jgi:hypothetical protein
MVDQQMDCDEVVALVGYQLLSNLERVQCLVEEFQNTSL